MRKKISKRIAVIMAGMITASVFPASVRAAQAGDTYVESNAEESGTAELEENISTQETDAELDARVSEESSEKKSDKENADQTDNEDENSSDNENAAEDTDVAAEDIISVEDGTEEGQDEILETEEAEVIEEETVSEDSVLSTASLLDDYGISLAALGDRTATGTYGNVEITITAGTWSISDGSTAGGATLSSDEAKKYADKFESEGYYSNQGIYDKYKLSRTAGYSDDCKLYSVQIYDKKGKSYTPSKESTVTLKMDDLYDLLYSDHTDVFFFTVDSSGNTTKLVPSINDNTVTLKTKSFPVYMGIFDLNGGIPGSSGGVVFAKGQTGTHNTIDTVDSTSLGVKMYMYKFPISEDYFSNSFFFSKSDGDSRIFANGETGNIEDQLGILEPLLGEDGYPVKTDTKESFEQWFSTSSDAYDAVQTNHLFSQDVYDSTGYLYYNCMDNYAYLDQSQTDPKTGNYNFKVYEDIGVPWWGYAVGEDGTPIYPKNSKWSNIKSDMRHGQFFPYDDLTDFKESFKQTTNFDLKDLDKNDPQYNKTLYRATGYTFHYGMYINANFIQPEDGKVSGGTSSEKTNMRYEFTGDDDLWVFIDGVLVMDIGGMHTSRSGYIDFATGEVSYYGLSSPTTLKAIFENAGVVDSVKWEGNTFADNTLHSFKMFYMERGENCGDLLVKMNLNTIPLDAEKHVYNAAGKDINKESVHIGDLLTYKITIDGITEAASNITLTDKVPEGTEFRSADNSGTLSDDTVTWNIDNSGGSTQTVSFTVKVKDDTDISRIENTAHVNAELQLIGEVNFDTNKVVNTIPTALRKTIKDSDGNDMSGKVLETGKMYTYEIKATNTNDAENPNQTFTITDDIPGGMTITEAKKGTVSGDTVTWDETLMPNGNNVTWTGTIEPDATAIIRISVTPNMDNTYFENQAKWWQTEDDPLGPSRVVKNWTLGIPVKAVVNAGEEDINGQYVAVDTDEITYKITVNNPTKDTVTFKITDALPVGMEYIAGSASDDGNLADGILTWSVPVEPGNYTVSFKVKAMAYNTQYDNTAIASVDNFSKTSNTVTVYTAGQTMVLPETGGAGTAVIYMASVLFGMMAIVGIKLKRII